MRIGALGDDFTGSADLANMTARAGLATRLYSGPPEGPAGSEQAAIVALKTRSIPAADAVEQSVRAADWLLREGAERVLFKYCSTFDSTPEGNIGPVTQALADRLGAEQVLFVPSFPETGRTVYQGHLFVGNVLLSESPLARHPLNPMTDPDIRPWLRRQTGRGVGHLPLHALRSEDPEGALRCVEAPFVVADAIDDGDIRRLGRLLVRAPLVTGGSAIGAGLAEALGAEGRGYEGWTGTAGSAVILAGSCSATTLGQIEAHRGPRRLLEVEEALADPARAAAEIAAWVDEAAGGEEAPLVAASQPPEAVRMAQARHGRERIAVAIEDTFARLARDLAELGVTRFVVAGGETSGAVATGLGIQGFEVGPQIAPGVPALAAGPLRLALKSGNFGGPDFFREAVSALGAQP